MPSNGLGVQATGVAPLIGQETARPIQSYYTKIKFFGQNTGVRIDKIWGRNIPMTLDLFEAYKEHYLNQNYVNWDPTTYLLSEFGAEEGRKAQGGNIVGLTNDIKELRLYKHTVGDTSQLIDRKLIFASALTDKDGKQVISYKDYSNPNNVNRYYTLFLSTGIQNSGAIESDNVKSQYQGYFLIDVDNNKSYRIHVNVTGDTQTLNTNYTKYDTNTQFPTFSVGKERYLSTSLGAVLLADQGDVQTNTLTLLQEFKDFIFSTRKKIFKTPKGEVWEVFTSDYSESILAQGIKSQPYISEFTITQIGEVE